MGPHMRAWQIFTHCVCLRKFLGLLFFWYHGNIGCIFLTAKYVVSILNHIWCFVCKGGKRGGNNENKDANKDEFDK